MITLYALATFLVVIQNCVSDPITTFKDWDYVAANPLLQEQFP